MSVSECINTLNKYGASGVPFLFLVDFEMRRPRVFRVEDIAADRILYNINGVTNDMPVDVVAKPFAFELLPPDFADYKEKFDLVWTRLLYGDSYLANLTIKTEVRTTLGLMDIYYASRAKYKLWFEDQFLVFSPETFVRIEDGAILSYPMKGTIDATVPDAGKKILGDQKELAEHVTIVDLIRNDLSAVADKVSVARFRYVEEIRTMQKNLLQVSSEIRGTLPDGYQRRLGDILFQLLPAGSVSGAPKRKTLDIIYAAEKEPRGYYTGVVGVFDGRTLDSGVMIRYLEREGEKLYYRSGGGITVQSDVQTEYQEAIDKIYVPFN